MYARSKKFVRWMVGTSVCAYVFIGLVDIPNFLNEV